MKIVWFYLNSCPVRRKIFFSARDSEISQLQKAPEGSLSRFKAPEGCEVWDFLKRRNSSLHHFLKFIPIFPSAFIILSSTANSRGMIKCRKHSEHSPHTNSRVWKYSLIFRDINILAIFTCIGSEYVL